MVKAFTGVAARDSEKAHTIRHHDVLPLAHDLKACLFQRTNGLQVVDARNFAHT
jgi:hypothetical protein